MAELATIARPYAEALYQVARQGDLAAWGAQVQVLADLAGNDELRQYVDNPKVSPEQAYELIVAAAKQPLQAGVQNFLRTLLENGRLAALPAIAEQFHALVNAAGGVADAEIFSAYPIEPAQLADIVVTLEKRFGRKLAPVVTLAPELIGGIRVVVGDEVLDTSVKARLERMKLSLRA
jgi:F-type H+-transporting ATPase subunit delta